MSDEELPPDLIGWGAVILPREPRIREIPIREADRKHVAGIDKQMRRALAYAEEDHKVQRMGILSSYVTELAIMEHKGPQIGAGAILVSEELGHPFWWIEAYKQEGGTSTSVHKLEASSADEARKFFRMVPVVRTSGMMSAFMDVLKDAKAKK